MKHLTLLISFLFFTTASIAQQNNKIPAPQIDQLKAPLYSPFVERYILDELKSLRVDQNHIRIELVEKMADSKLSAADRAISYTADTTNNIFYIITIAASLLVLLGWRSLSDVKNNIESITAEKIAKLTDEYENRLDEIERKVKKRTELIIEAQQEIANTNLVHSLWMRAGLEKSEQEKISIYDQILELNPEDIEALTYKADILLDLDEDSWSLSLSNQAIEIDPEYALAYWQRACAKAKLDKAEEAVADIKLALELTESLKDEVMNEIYFENLKSYPCFKELMGTEEQQSV